MLIHFPVPWKKKDRFSACVPVYFNAFQYMQYLWQNTGFESVETLARSRLTLLSANPTKWSNTLKRFNGFCRRIVWVCLTILWGWCLKSSEDHFSSGWNPKLHERLSNLTQEIVTKFRFSDDFRGNRIWLIHLNSLNVRSLVTFCSE